MNEQHHITLIDIIIMMIIYGLCCSVLNFSLEMIMMSYMPFITVVSMSQILWIGKKYGEVTYIKSSNYCSFKCFISMLVAMVLIYVLGKNTSIHPVVLCGLMSVVMLYIIKEKLCLVFYEQGLVYKGSYVPYKDLRQGVVLKNYHSEYEIYVDRKVIILDSEAYGLVK